jgi:hypothetical protein
MTSPPFFLPTTLPGDGGDSGAVADPTGGLDDGTLAEIVALCAQSQDLLIKQYSDATKLRALLCALIDPIQAIETATAAVYSEVLNVDAAEGVHLDLLGRIVREARNGLSDYVYRRAIRTRILINRSQGRLPDLVAVARMFEDMDITGADADAYVRVTDAQPARTEVRVIHTPANTPREVHKRVRQAKAAGVALTTMTIPYPAETLRGFTLIRAADYPEKSVTNGLCPEADRTAGGYLLHGMAGTW